MFVVCLLQCCLGKCVYINSFYWLKNADMVLKFIVVVVDYVRIILIILASTFFHTQPGISLTLYILSTSLDGKFLPAF